MNKATLTLLSVGAIAALVVLALLMFQGPSQTPDDTAVLRIALQPIEQTDPAFISADSEIALANAVFDYLVDVDEANAIQPRLASEWTISKDGLTYTFTLANGVRFHDGSDLTPKDVVWSFNRLRNPEVGGATVSLYENIETIEVIGSNQVRFVLKAPNPFFLYDLSDNHAVVVKEGATDLAQGNGTGPFLLAEEDLQDRVTLASNPDYFIEGQPLLGKLVFVFFNDQSAAIDALRGGQVDLVWRMSNAQLLSLKDEAGIRTVDVPTNGFDLVRLRADRPPGNDPRVVRAFKLATDRKQAWEFVQMGLGAEGRDSPIGPLFSDWFSTATPVPARDPQAAKQLLAEAGYPDGLTMDLHVPNTGGRPDLAVVLKEQWAEASIHVNVQLEPESIYYGENHWLEVDLGITGWGSRPTPQFFFDVMLECGAQWNEAKFCDEEFDRWSKLAGSTLDEAQRKTAYAEMQRILIERGPIIIPYFFAATAAIRDAFDGFSLKAFAGRTDFRRVGKR